MTKLERDTVEQVTVSKLGECSCGGNYQLPCAHVEAVKEYVDGGGKKADLTETQKVKVSLPEECPVCGGEIKAFRPFRCRRWFWRCDQGWVHFWEWLAGEAVKLFLTRPHENKVGAFYRRTPEERRKIPDAVDKEMEEYFGQHKQ